MLLVIDDFTPKLTVEAVWSSKYKSSLGNNLKPKKLDDAPAVTLIAPSPGLWHCTSSVTYAITLTDPDAPSRDDPKWSEMCHWIATGVSSAQEGTDGLEATSCAALTLSDLEDVMPYKAPAPPKKTGKHRYVLLVFVAANGTTDSLHLSKPSDRQHWGYGEKDHGVRDWAKDNGLVPIGEFLQASMSGRLVC